MDDGSTAPRGIYLYRLSAYVYGSAPPDRDSNRSDYLFAERAYNENNEPILEAEYWGYDDHGTPDDDTDDEHLYFIRWYVLRDTRNASSGEVWLFDPELQRVGTWNLAELPCVEHNNQPDGLTASTAGAKHGVIVRVPVSLMVTPGEYLFVVHAVDDHPDEEKCHRRKPALPLNAVTYEPAVTDIGFYLNSTYNDDQKLRWDGGNPANPGACEFAILRQQPGGNKLYIMAHVKASKRPPISASVKAWLVTSVSDQAGIPIRLHYGGPCPSKPGEYHFYRPIGQEIEMTDGASEPYRKIRVRMTNEGIDEVTTFDHASNPNTSNYLDSMAIESGLATYQLRGKARYRGTSLTIPVLYTMLRYVKSAGVEKITVIAQHKRDKMHTLPVKNQADILYYSGHGHSATGELECWDSGGRFTVSEVNPAANWREDLDYFIIAGCSVLRPDATNGFAWGNATLKQGILRGLCGYHDAAPADSGGAVTIAQEFAQMVNSGSAPHYSGDLVLDAWLEVNRKRSARGIAYNRNHYWWVKQEYFGEDSVVGPISW